MYIIKICFNNTQKPNLMYFKWQVLAGHSFQVQDLAAYRLAGRRWTNFSRNGLMTQCIIFEKILSGQNETTEKCKFSSKLAKPQKGAFRKD